MRQTGCFSTSIWIDAVHDPPSLSLCSRAEPAVLNSHFICGCGFVCGVGLWVWVGGCKS
jgi:hypothetical protein